MVVRYCLNALMSAAELSAEEIDKAIETAADKEEQKAYLMLVRYRHGRLGL